MNEEEHFETAYKQLIDALSQDLEKRNIAYNAYAEVRAVLQKNIRESQRVEFKQMIEKVRASMQEELSGDIVKDIPMMTNNAIIHNFAQNLMKMLEPKT